MDGLNSDADAGAGRNNIAELANAYPTSALVVGVSMNGEVDAVASGQYNANIDTLLNTLLVTIGLFIFAGHMRLMDHGMATHRVVL
ncbi:hypothetical protein JCM19239_1611 [Vibrio variabilis]|uniref:Uncharacterized protein n=1 Tax=Vibrio variabilis TaxID=990271 RepID=A0ABQ0JQL5_9VIBR|nr:hypothetical protein JCM19239_1611 [Vibrio variabilis]